MLNMYRGRERDEEIKQGGGRDKKIKRGEGETLCVIYIRIIYIERSNGEIKLCFQRRGTERRWGVGGERSDANR